MAALNPPSGGLCILSIGQCAKVVSFCLRKWNITTLCRWTGGLLNVRLKSCLCSLGRAVICVVLVSRWVIWAHRKQNAEFGWRWLWACCLSFLELYSHIWVLTIEKLEHLFLLPVSETSVCSVPITDRFKVRQFWLPYKRSFYTESSEGIVLLTATYIKKIAPNQYFW